MMNAVPRRLPIELVIRRSFLYAWESRAVLMTPLIIYAVVTMLADIAVNGLLGANDRPAKILMTVAEQVFTVGFSVGIHRFVLAGEVRPGFAFFRWDRHFVRYLLLTLLLLLLMAVAVLMVLGAVGFSATPQPDQINGPMALIGLVALFVVSIVISRLSLLLPAAALGDEVPAKVIWQASAGNGFRLLTTTLLTAMPFLIVEMILAGLSGGGQLSLIVTILASLVASAQLIVLTIMLALCYDVLVRGGGPPAQKNEGPDDQVKQPDDSQEISNRGRILLRSDDN